MSEKSRPATAATEPKDVGQMPTYRYQSPPFGSYNQDYKPPAEKKSETEERRRPVAVVCQNKLLGAF